MLLCTRCVSQDEVQLRFRIEGGSDFETPPRQLDRLQRAYVSRILGSGG